MEWYDICTNDKYQTTTKGDICNKKTGRILSGGINNSGYRTVHLTHSEPPEFVHRIVADMFVKNDDPVHKTDVNHKDGNKLNNDFTNLEWVSRSDNVKHAYANGLNRPSGGGHNKMQVYVEEIGKFYDSQEDCVRDIGGSIGALSMVLNGKRKKDTYRGYHVRRT